MMLDILQLTVTVVSVLLFLRIYWIQASSSSLVSMMNMQDEQLLNEIEVNSCCDKMDRGSVIQVASYLNLVAKLYLNHSINIQMLNTFEGVMMKLVRDHKFRALYRDIFYEFRDDLKTAEPPYINLIYTTDLLERSNTILNRRRLLSGFWAWCFIFRKKNRFRFVAPGKQCWALAESVVAGAEQGGIEKQKDRTDGQD